MLRARIRLILLISLSTAACNTTNVLRDTGDVAGAEINTGRYGLSLRAGPFKAGIDYKDKDGLACGFRYSYAGCYETEEWTGFFIGEDSLRHSQPKSQKKDKDSAAAAENQLTEEEILQLRELAKEDPRFDPDNLTEEQIRLIIQQRENQKQKDEPADNETGGLLIPPGSNDAAIPDIGRLKEKKGILNKRNKAYRARSPFGTNAPIQYADPVLKDFDKNPDRFAGLSYMSSIEIQAGIYFGGKLTLNPAEFIDLLFSFFGADLLADNQPYISNELRKMKESPQWQQLSPEQREELEKLYR